MNWVTFTAKRPTEPGDYWVVWGGSGSKVRVTFHQHRWYQNGVDVTANVMMFPQSVWSPVTNDTL